MRPLARARAPADVWAVDGGQGLVADARCLQVYVTRAARVRWRQGHAWSRKPGPVRAHLLGLGEERAALAASGRTRRRRTAPVDVNLLRDWEEWRTVSECVAGVRPGGHGPGRRRPPARLAHPLVVAGRSAGRGRRTAGDGRRRDQALIAVSRRRDRCSVSSSGRRRRALGPRACWWVPVARTRPDVEPGIQVVVARLDPDARFSFRVDLPGGRWRRPPRSWAPWPPCPTTPPSPATPTRSAWPTAWRPAPAGCGTRCGIRSGPDWTGPVSRSTCWSGRSRTATG